MTYYKAVEIKQHLLVNLQYSGALHKKPAEALKETAEKYTVEQYSEALRAIKQHLREEYDDTKKLFGLAVASKRM